MPQENQQTQGTIDSKIENHAVVTLLEKYKSYLQENIETVSNKINKRYKLSPEQLKIMIDKNTGLLNKLEQDESNLIKKGTIISDQLNFLTDLRDLLTRNNASLELFTPLYVYRKQKEYPKAIAEVYDEIRKNNSIIESLKNTTDSSFEKEDISTTIKKYEAYNDELQDKANKLEQAKHIFECFNSFRDILVDKNHKYINLDKKIDTLSGKKKNISFELNLIEVLRTRRRLCNEYLDAIDTRKSVSECIDNIKNRVIPPNPNHESIQPYLKEYSAIIKRFASERNPDEHKKLLTSITKNKPKNTTSRTDKDTMPVLKRTITFDETTSPRETIGFSQSLFGSIRRISRTYRQSTNNRPSEGLKSALRTSPRTEEQKAIQKTRFY